MTVEVVADGRTVIEVTFSAFGIIASAILTSTKGTTLEVSCNSPAIITSSKIKCAFSKL